MLERFKVPKKDEVRVPIESLQEVIRGVFEKMGNSESDAIEASEVLAMTDLRGVETHGVSNMLRAYVSQYTSGQVNPTTQLAHRARDPRHSRHQRRQRTWRRSRQARYGHRNREGAQRRHGHRNHEQRRTPRRGRSLLHVRRPTRHGRHVRHLSRQRCPPHIRRRRALRHEPHFHRRARQQGSPPALRRRHIPDCRQQVLLGSQSRLRPAPRLDFRRRGQPNNGRDVLSPVARVSTMAACYQWAARAKMAHTRATASS